jgi:hypothetical protein
MKQNNQRSGSIAEPENNEKCKGITKKGTHCKNKRMKGFEYCSQHQATCSYEGPKGEICRNFVEEGAFCVFHSPNDEPRDITSQQTSFLKKAINIIQDAGVSRREFITFSWPGKIARDVAASITSLPRPIQIIGGVVAVGVAEYLIADFLSYFKETYGIEFLVPLSFKDRPQLEEVNGQDVGDHTTVPRIINKGTSNASVRVNFVDYSTGRIYSTPVVTIFPNHSYVSSLTDAHIPDGFHGGATVDSSEPVEGRPIIKLRIADDKLDPYSNQFLDFAIPVSQAVPLDIQNIISMIALGRREKLEYISDIPCIVKKDRLYFDRKAILDSIKTTGSTEGIFIVQLEGRFIIGRQIHDSASKYMQGYSPDRAETRFETTAEIVAISI